jgi:DNA-binding LacI/PurR family transcriptional regulator
MPVGIISKLQEKNVKFVWIANNIPHEKIYSVMFDKSDMYLKIVKRITERHIKKVAFVAPSLSSEDEKIFMGLCKQAKISARIFAYDVVKKTEEVRNIAAKDTLKLLFSSDIPKLIICGGETATHGVLEAIFSKGLKISEDIYIISVLESESLPFRLSVSFDILINSFFELAREATIILHQILEGKIPEHNIKYLPVMTKTLKI